MAEKSFARLADIMSFWEELGFERWTWENMSGVKRRVTFRKGSLLGEVARYCADDYIVWEHKGVGEVLKGWRPDEDVMTHRFLLLGSDSACRPLTRSFLFGFRGWVEVLPYRPGGSGVNRFQDLIFLVNKGLEYGKHMERGGCSQGE